MSLAPVQTNGIANTTLGLDATRANTTLNESQTSQRHISGKLSMPFEARVLLICLYVTIFLLGVTGNAAVCYIIGRVLIDSTKMINFF